ETLVFGDEQRQISTDQGFPLFKATATIYAASANLLQAKAERAVQDLKSGLDAYRDTGAGLALPYYLGLLADGLIQSGQLPEARSVLDEALVTGEESGDRSYEAELYRLAGDLELLDGAADRAEASYARALDVANAQGSKAWELRAATSLARFYGDS